MDERADYVNELVTKAEATATALGGQAKSIGEAKRLLTKMPDFLRDFATEMSQIHYEAQRAEYALTLLASEEGPYWSRLAPMSDEGMWFRRSPDGADCALVTLSIIPALGVSSELTPKSLATTPLSWRVTVRDAMSLHLVWQSGSAEEAWSLFQRACTQSTAAELVSLFPSA